MGVKQCVARVRLRRLRLPKTLTYNGYETILPKVIWEEPRRKVPVGYNGGRPKLTPKTAASLRRSVVDKGLRHSILPRRGGMTGQSAPTVLVCWSL